LETLQLDGTQITDEGLSHLAGLPRLTNLFLNRTSTTDAGIPHLARLSGLDRLELSQTQITDKGVAELVALANLRVLILDDTQLPDAAWDHWPNRPWVQVLSLMGTQVTRSGIAKPRVGVPRLSIRARTPRFRNPPNSETRDIPASSTN